METLTLSIRTTSFFQILSFRMHVIVVFFHVRLYDLFLVDASRKSLHHVDVGKRHVVRERCGTSPA